MSDAFSAPTSRNSPCPCGSGRRYKDCHGAMGEVPPAGGAAAAPRRSSYRAPGGEWAHVDDMARDALGARMEQALALQVAGRSDEAAREYQAVIAAAPGTHDALHMLGVIALNRGELDDAERLIDEALALRPPYVAIEHNRQLVQDARLARARAQPEQLAECALPILVDLALAATAPGRPGRAIGTPTSNHAAAKLHLIGRVHAGDHDDGWMLERVAAILSPRVTTVWAVDGDGTEATAAHRVERLDPGIAALPRGGVHVYIGVDFDASAWLELADADRVIVFCQGAAPTRYLEQLRAFSRDGARPVELVFPSQAMALRFGRGHHVLPPPFELGAPARPAERSVPRYDEWLVEPLPAWPVGIIGQNQQFLAEPTDADFVKTLTSVAGRLHIYDPGRFRYLLGGSPVTRFYTRRAGGLAPFLSSLACYVHRTETWWRDTVGRELFGAMALGIPVLCPRGSIHAERIENGVDGFLYGSADEAAQQLSDLRRAPALAAAIGRAAQEKMLALFDSDAQTRRYRDLVAGAAVISDAFLAAKVA